MLYLFDSAIVEDLKRTIDPDGGANPNVIMTDVDNYAGILAQIQNDTITYPLFLLVRHDDMPIKTDAQNFTRYMKGVPVGFNTKTNDVYYERAIPVDLKYTLWILTTNVADRDECAREIYYKYLSMYYLHIDLPYEIERRIKFGIRVDTSSGIQNQSGASQYTQSGAIYQSQIDFLTDGCVMITNTPRHLKIDVVEGISIENPKGDSAI